MSVININGRLVGDGQPVFIIAEVGINHNGSLKIAKQLVDVAVESGVDSVKFQKRVLSEVYKKEIIDDPNKSEQAFQYMIPILKKFNVSVVLFIFAK